MYISGLIKKCLGFYLVEFEKGLHVELLNLPHKKLVKLVMEMGSIFMVGIPGPPFVAIDGPCWPHYL